MSDETTISGLHLPEQLTGSTVSILAPGYTGKAVPLSGVFRPGGRGDGDLLPLAQAASGADVEILTRTIIELTPPPQPVAETGGRGEAVAPPRLIVPKVPGAEYAVLHTDEAGEGKCSRWLSPMDAADPTQAVFDLPAEAETAKGEPKWPEGREQANGEARGPGTKLMRRAVRVVAWTTSPIVGAGAKAAANLWENARRRYGLWQVDAGGAFGEPQWSEFKEGPALLLIHGTFSTPGAAFAGWVGAPAFTSIAERYRGRVLAFAHPTLAASPLENVEWLLEQLPSGADFGGPLDIVSHSRGGLVARELAAKAAIGAAPRVDRVCMVGSPNLGTPLVDAVHWTIFLDAYTNCLTWLPDTTATIALEGLLCLVKILGRGATEGLPGLASMDPGGDWVKTSGSRAVGSAQWFTVSANCMRARLTGEEILRRPVGVVGEAGIRAFFEAENDLVVPTDGCHRPGAAVVDSLRLEGRDTNHCNYFFSGGVHDALGRWLGSTQS